MSNTLFSSVTAAQNTSACTPLDLPGDCEVSLYASGPKSGTWSATVTFWELRGDGELAEVAHANLTQAGPYPGGTGVRVYDQKNYMVNGGSTIFADVTNVTGTIPAPGLYAEGK
jgi:hypothetical protein